MSITLCRQRCVVASVLIFVQVLLGGMGSAMGGRVWKLVICLANARIISCKSSEGPGIARPCCVSRVNLIFYRPFFLANLIYVMVQPRSFVAHRKSVVAFHVSDHSPVEFRVHVH